MKIKIYPAILTPIFVILISACVPESTKDYSIKPVAFSEVKIHDSFWLPRIETDCKITIPLAFQKCEETGRIDNFSKAGGLMAGEFIGRRYNDSDVFKVMEGAAYSLSLNRDPELENYMDGLIAMVASAQEDDGYLYTTRTIDPDHPAPGAGRERWSNLGSSHELYNVGHMYEAAVAYYLATGKRSLLDVAVKNADFIARVFGPGKKRGFPGHQEIEIGLVKLYRITGNDEYLKLAKFFLDERGRQEHPKKFSETSDFSVYNQDWYLQAHKPVVDQDAAVGHAVRATYMYSGMADVAALTGVEAYIQAIETIWENVVSKKLYVTGGIGSRHEGEAFGDDYELPNATAYNETCAAIGNVFWNHRLFLLRGEAKYLDVLERTLYNGLLSGISLSGERFFYPNPLESDGIYTFNQGDTTRKSWFDCACCPSNIVRFLPSLPGYIYAQTGSILYINLFVESSAAVKINENPVIVAQRTRYPWEGKIKIAIEPAEAAEFAIHIRIPGWARGKPVPSDLYTYLNPGVEPPSLKINSKDHPIELEKGFVRIHRKWEPEDLIELDLPMPIRRIISHENVRENLNKIALQRGPIVYCLEAVDNYGTVLERHIPDSMRFEVEFCPNLLGGVNILRGRIEGTGRSIVAVPYYSWSHRGAGEMTVWIARGYD